MKPLMTTTGISTGGREGRARLAEGGAAFAMSLPKALDGDADGMNPEQLFAMGWSSCFGQAVAALAKKHDLDAAKAETRVSVTLNKDETSFALSAEIALRIPGADADRVRALLEDAHQICPYSKATRGNVDVTLTVA